jgi:TetR/AcrR family transcriptional regulator, fatty acid biosynthesis regulator
MEHVSIIKKPVRRRLDPVVRRELILDAAAALVMGEGLTAVSMERIARDAGVSKALVYSYFPGRDELMGALLLREYEAFQRESREAAAKVEGIESLVRATTRSYLTHVAARGALVRRLVIEPNIAVHLQNAEEAGRMTTSVFFAKALSKEYGIGKAQATMLVQMLLGLTGSAGDYLAAHNSDIDEITEHVTTMVLAALEPYRQR